MLIPPCAKSDDRGADGVSGAWLLAEYRTAMDGFRASRGARFFIVEQVESLRMSYIAHTWKRENDGPAADPR